MPHVLAEPVLLLGDQGDFPLVEFAEPLAAPEHLLVGVVGGLVGGTQEVEPLLVELGLLLDDLAGEGEVLVQLSLEVLLCGDG